MNKEIRIKNFINKLESLSKRYNIIVVSHDDEIALKELGIPLNGDDNDILIYYYNGKYKRYKND